MSKEENKINENDENVTQENTEKVSQEANEQEQKEFAKQAKIIMDEAEKAKEKFKENTLCLLEKTRVKLTEIGYQKLFWILAGAFVFYIFVSLWTVSVISSNNQSYQKDIKIAITENKVAIDVLNRKVDVLIHKTGNNTTDLNNVDKDKIIQTFTSPDKSLDILFINKSGNSKLVKYDFIKGAEGQIYLNSVIELKR